MKNIYQRMSEGCDKDCEFEYWGSTTTLVAWKNTYDKNGNPIGGGDPNTVTTAYRCKTCGAHFQHAVNEAAQTDELTKVAL